MVKLNLTVSDAPPEVRLAVYLRDHLAAGAAGHQLAMRTLENNRGTVYEAALAQLERELGEERDTLRRVAASLGITPAPGKERAAQAAEWLGRWKLNGQLRGYSPLSRVIELEGLAAGVVARQRVWAAVEACGLQGRLPAGVDVADQQSRAQDQLDRLQSQHAVAVREAFPNA
jgi:hypothetical protein